MKELDIKVMRELTEKELDHCFGRVSSNLTYQTPSGNSTQGHGEGLTLVNHGGNAPPGQQ